MSFGSRWLWSVPRSVMECPIGGLQDSMYHQALTSVLSSQAAYKCTTLKLEKKKTVSVNPPRKELTTETVK